MLTEIEKSQISKAVAEWTDENLSDRSANSLAKRSGVNIRYVTAIKRGDTFTEQDGSQIRIKDEHYIKVREIVMGPADGIHFDSKNFQKVQDLCRFSQTTHRRAMIDSYESGAGKTYALEHYARVNSNVLYVKVTSLMKGRDLIELLCDKLNLRYDKRVSNTRKLIDITDKLVRPGYLIILDELESCSTDMYRVLKDLEDATYRRCGLIISGLGIIQEMEYAANRKKKLMPQLWRRFRANRLMLGHMRKADIESACNESGISENGAIKALQELVTDYAMLSEYIRDVKTEILDQGHELNAVNVRSLFLNTAA